MAPTMVQHARARGCGYIPWHYAAAARGRALDRRQRGGARKAGARRMVCLRAPTTGSREGTSRARASARRAPQAHRFGAPRRRRTTQRARRRRRARWRDAGRTRDENASRAPEGPAHRSGAASSRLAALLRMAGHQGALAALRGRRCCSQRRSREGGRRAAGDRAQILALATWAPVRTSAAQCSSASHTCQSAAPCCARSSRAPRSRDVSSRGDPDEAEQVMSSHVCLPGESRRFSGVKSPDVGAAAPPLAPLRQGACALDPHTAACKGFDRSCTCQAIEVATTSLNSLAGSSLLHSRDGTELLQQLPREAETLRRSSAPMCALVHASCEIGNPGIAVSALNTAYPDPTVMPFEVSLAP